MLKNFATLLRFAAAIALVALLAMPATAQTMYPDPSMDCYGMTYFYSPDSTVPCKATIVLHDVVYGNAGYVSSNSPNGMFQSEHWLVVTYNYTRTDHQAAGGTDDTYSYPGNQDTDFIDLGLVSSYISVANYADYTFDEEVDIVHDFGPDFHAKHPDEHPSPTEWTEYTLQSVTFHPFYAVYLGYYDMFSNFQSVTGYYPPWWIESNPF
jgi:hypothetical protein